MATITIDIEKAKLTTDAESLLWKYGVATESTATARQANNVKSDGASRPVDGRVLTSAMLKRAAAAADIMRDFNGTITETNNSATPPVAVIRFSASFSTRWSGTQRTLQEALEKYILDGMMADYLNVTAPTEAQMFSGQLAEDAMGIRRIVYSLDKPAMT